MNWDDLRYFLAIAESGTLAGAARRLSVNHSTVFRRLNALEDDLEVRLFDRLPEGYVLTPAGERMRELGRQADTAFHDIERELAGRDLAPLGVVRLTAAPNIARTIVPDAIRFLRREHPGIVVEVMVGDSDYDLSRREADIALRATSRPPDYLVGRRVATLEWSVCGRKSSREKGSSDKNPGNRHSRDRRPTGPDDLAGHPLIGADASLTRLPAFRWLADTYPDDIVARASDLSTMAALSIAGVGYAVLPGDQREPGLARLFTVPGILGELWLLTHPDLRNVRRIRAVWDALADATARRLGTSPGGGRE